MIAAFLILLAVAMPLRDSGGDSDPLAEIDTEDAFGYLDVTSADDVPCDSESPCPTGEGCVTCTVCCKVAVPPLALCYVGAAATPPALSVAVPLWYAPDPGCSVWHPPRG